MSEFCTKIALQIFSHIRRTKSWRGRLYSRTKRVQSAKNVLNNAMSGTKVVFCGTKRIHMMCMSDTTQVCVGCVSKVDNFGTCLLSTSRKESDERHFVDVLWAILSMKHTFVWLSNHIVCQNKKVMQVSTCTSGRTVERLSRQQRDERWIVSKARMETGQHSVTECTVIKT